MRRVTSLPFYTKKKDAFGLDFSLSEQYLYGASRLGVLRPNLKLAANDKNFVMDSVCSHTLGQKNYELTNHLGNVLALVSDEKQSAIVAEVLSVSDYYPFGMEMPGRKFVKYASEEYRFGFTGHEKESDMVEGVRFFGWKIRRRKR